MTPEEIEQSEDVSELFAQLKAAKAFGDEETARLIQARMRELSGAGTRTVPDTGRRVAADDAAVEKVHRDARWGIGHL